MMDYNYKILGRRNVFPSQNCSILLVYQYSRLYVWKNEASLGTRCLITEAVGVCLCVLLEQVFYSVSLFRASFNPCAITLLLWSSEIKLFADRRFVEPNFCQEMVYPPTTTPREGLLI